ncbi:MAG: T9SS type A sorting domain-containing protein, partial [Flavobacteriales bacterium]
STPGCNYSLTRTVTATDRYGNTRTTSRSVSYKLDTDAPVITATGSVEDGSDLGCNPSSDAINAALGSATAMDFCDGELSVTATDDNVVMNGCSYSQTRIFSAIDDCGNESAVTRTIQWIYDVTAPVVVCPANVVAGDCNTTSICNATATDACDNNAPVVSYNYACGYEFPVGVTTVTASATDACGNTGSCNFTVTIVENPTCNLAAPAVMPMAGSVGNSLCAAQIDGLTYSWTVSGAGWAINAGANSNCVTYTAGNAGTSGIFCLTITNQFGCSSSCCVTLNSVGSQFCTYTQGFYGGNGKNCSQQTVIQVINQALASGNLVIGNPANNRSVTILSNQGACLQSKMPSGSTAIALPVGNVTCATATGSSYVSANGRFVNVLLGQTIALGLNLRNSSGLSSFVLAGTQFTTAKASTCANGTPLAGTEQTFCIPANVWNYLSPKTVGKLYELANQALGGNTPSGLTISDINAAVDAINRGFDNCRIVVGFGTCPTTRADMSEVNEEITGVINGLAMVTYPNPMGDEATVSFSSDSDVNARVEIFSSRGELVTTIFNGEMKAGENRSVQFDASSLASGLYICRFAAGETVRFNKIIINR